MAVAFESSASNTGATSTTNSTAHTLGSVTDGALFVLLRTYLGTSHDSVTFDGENLTQIGSTLDSGDSFTSVWVIVDPTQGSSADLVTTTGGSAQHVRAHLFFSGVDQTTPYENNTLATGTGSTTTSTADDILVAAIATYIGGTNPAADHGSATEREFEDNGGANDSIRAYTIPGSAGSVDTSFTSSGNTEDVTIELNINAAAAASGNSPISTLTPIMKHIAGLG